MTTDTKTKRTNLKGAQNKNRKVYNHAKRVFNPMFDEIAPWEKKSKKSKT